MSAITTIAAVIPARMAARRYPGKPLLEINGLPMVEHVRRRAVLCNGFSEVVVATCDREIADAIDSFGGKIVMTSPHHSMATDRVAEAAKELDCTHVVNVQGDEILIRPQDLERMVAVIEGSPKERYWNATAPIESARELEDTAIVKCVVSESEKILYCGRDFSHLKLKPNFEPVRKILGILGYSRVDLFNYSQLSRTPLETTQSIDQFRILEHDIPMHGVRFSAGYPGINNKREEKEVRRIIRDDPNQRKILKLILDNEE